MQVPSVKQAAAMGSHWSPSWPTSIQAAMPYELIWSETILEIKQVLVYVKVKVLKIAL